MVRSTKHDILENVFSFSNVVISQSLVSKMLFILQYTEHVGIAENFIKNYNLSCICCHSGIQSNQIK